MLEIFSQVNVPLNVPEIKIFNVSLSFKLKSARVEKNLSEFTVVWLIFFFLPH